MLTYEVTEPARSDDGWHVEAVDHDSEGEIYVAVFYGPGAKERAEEYADWKNRVG